MKKIFVILIIALGFFNCKDEAKKVDLEENRAKSYDANDGYITMMGDFVYDESKNAAVLQIKNEVYGIVIDDNMRALSEEVKPFKEDEYTSVPVTIRVKRIENTDNTSLWKYKLEIKEILKVEAPDPNRDNVIKLAN